MSTEKYREELSDELRISKPMLKKYIHTVGTNKENIKDYAKNGSCAIVRKDNGFDISYVAQMLNEKDAKIKELEQRLANCIDKPKFKVKDTIFVIVDDNIEEYFVDEIILRNEGTLWAYYDIDKITEITEKNKLFATEEEAKKKLGEMGNGCFEG